MANVALKGSTLTLELDEINLKLDELEDVTSTSKHETDARTLRRVKSLAHHIENRIIRIKGGDPSVIPTWWTHRDRLSRLRNLMD